MKINHIKKLSIVFCISFLFANEKEEVLKAVISHAGSSGEITTEYIVEVFNDQRLQEEEMIIKRFQKKPEKIKTYLEYKKIFI